MACLCCITSSERISKKSQANSNGHEVIKGDSAVSRIPFHNYVQGLRCQVVPPAFDGIMQLVWLNCSRSISIILIKCPPPLIKASPKLFELIKSHFTTVIPIQHAYHDPACFQAEHLIGTSNSRLRQTSLQLNCVNLSINSGDC